MKINGSESTHFYTYDGKPVFGATLREARKQNLLPGVSSICKMWPSDGLKGWLRQQDILAAATTPRLQHEPDDAWIARVLHAADEESQKGRDTGTRRHDLIHGFHNGGLSYLAADDEKFLWPYIDWFTKYVTRVERCESIVTNTALGYAGTMDALVTLMDGRKAVIDIKNRKRAAVYDSDAMQLEAYCHCVPSEDGLPAPISVVLGTEKPEIKVQDWSLSRGTAWDNFVLCLQLWRASKNYYPKQPQEAA